jgi:hypothetical protein
MRITLNYPKHKETRELYEVAAVRVKVSLCDRLCVAKGKTRSTKHLTLEDCTEDDDATTIEP